MVSMKIPSTVTIGQSIPLNWTRDSDQEVLSFYLGFLNDTCTSCEACPSGCVANGQVVNSNHALSGQVNFQVPSNTVAGRYRVVPLNAQGTDTGGASNLFTAVSPAGSDLQSTTLVGTSASATSATSTIPTSTSSSSSISTDTSVATSPVSVLAPPSTTTTSANTSSGSSSSTSQTATFGTSTGIAGAQPTTPQSSSSSTSTRTNTVPIIAGVTVAIVFVLVSLILLWWYKRRRAARFSDSHFPSSAKEYNDSQANLLARPFVDGRQLDPYTTSTGISSGSGLLSPASVVSPASQTPSAKQLKPITQSKTPISASYGLGSQSPEGNVVNSEVEAENMRLRAEIQWLREQYDSPGLTHELPPEYPGTAAPP